MKRHRAPRNAHARVPDLFPAGRFRCRHQPSESGELIMDKHVRIRLSSDPRPTALTVAPQHTMIDGTQTVLFAEIFNFCYRSTCHLLGNFQRFRICADWGRSSRTCQLTTSRRSDSLQHGNPFENPNDRLQHSFDFLGDLLGNFVRESDRIVNRVNVQILFAILLDISKPKHRQSGLPRV